MGKPPTWPTKVADEAWVSACLEIRDNEAWDGVAIEDIEGRASREFYAGERPRVGVKRHADGHIVANKKLSTGTGYRMLTATPTNLRRPFIPGDFCAPGRDGKMVPDRRDLPQKFWEVLDWYEQVYKPRIRNRKPSMERKALSDTPSLPALNQPIIRVLTPKSLGSQPSEAMLSHEILLLRSSQAPSKMLLVEGLNDLVHRWLSKNAHAMGDVQLLELKADGSTAPFGDRQ